MRYVKLSHEVTHATYDEKTGKWHLRIRRANPETGIVGEIEDVTDILLTAFGALSRWQMPDIPGIKDYKGVLHHSAGFDPEDKTWQEVVDGWKDKRVGIIGVVSFHLSTKRHFSVCGDYLLILRNSYRVRARSNSFPRCSRAFRGSSTS